MAAPFRTLYISSTQPSVLLTGCLLSLPHLLPRLLSRTSVTSIRLTHLLLFHLPSPQLANRHSIKCKPLALNPTRQREHKGGQALLKKDIAQACGTAPQCTASHSGASASSSQILVHTPAHLIRKQSQDPCPSKRALESNSFGPQPRNYF